MGKQINYLQFQISAGNLLMSHYLSYSERISNIISFKAESMLFIQKPTRKQKPQISAKITIRKTQISYLNNIRLLRPFISTVSKERFSINQYLCQLEVTKKWITYSNIYTKTII